MSTDGTILQASRFPSIARIKRHLTITSPVGDLRWRSTSARQGATLICISGVILATLFRSPTADAAFGLTALVIYGAWTDWNTPGLGLGTKPLQGWTYWLKVALILGAIVGSFSSFAWLAALAMGIPVFVPQIDPSNPAFSVWLLHLLFLAPIFEEMAYRFALCVPITGRLGAVRTILLSGTVFALAHFIGGNPGPDNFIAGFVLTWAFLKSGTLLIPILLHFAGNLCVLFFGVLMFYWPVFVLHGPKWMPK